MELQKQQRIHIDQTVHAYIAGCCQFGLLSILEDNLCGYALPNQIIRKQLAFSYQKNNLNFDKHSKSNNFVALDDTQHPFKSKIRGLLRIGSWSLRIQYSTNDLKNPALFLGLKRRFFLGFEYAWAGHDLSYSTQKLREIIWPFRVFRWCFLNGDKLFMLFCAHLDFWGQMTR